jgi:hypothetical protein
VLIDTTTPAQQTPPCRFRGTAVVSSGALETPALDEQEYCANRHGTLAH